MNIAFYRHSLLSRGGDKMFLTYANYLTENGHHITLYVQTIDSVFKISDRIKVSLIPIKGKTGSILWAILHKIKAEVIIADIIVMACLLSIRNFRRVIYFAQDFDVSYYSNRVLQEFIKLLYVFGLTFLKIPCIAVADSLKAELQSFSKNTIVVSNGINLNIFYPCPDADLIKLKESRKTILILGRKDSRKGLATAVATLNEYSKRIPNDSIEIWVVGETLPESLFTYKIRNFSYVNERRLSTILSSVDVLLYPSKHEGLPLFILEALACGCPIVTTEAVKIVEPQQQAWVTKIDDVPALVDGLHTVLTDINLRRKFIENGKRLSQQFDINQKSQEFAEVLATFDRRRYSLQPINKVDL